MKFKFSLETLLNLKEQHLEGLKEELSRLLTSLGEAEERLEGLRKRRIWYRDEFRRRQQEGLSSLEILYYEDFLSDLEDKIHRQRERVEGLKVEIEKKREEILRASRELKTLQRLKERRWREFKRELQRQEGLLLDEFGLRRKAFPL